MSEEQDSLHDHNKWDYLWNNPDLAKREAFRLWNTNSSSLTKQQKSLIIEIFNA